MEASPTPSAQGPWKRPKALARLCTFSFIDQGGMFMLFGLSLLGVLVVGVPTVEEVQHQANVLLRGQLKPEQMKAIADMVPIMREHGVALFSVFLLRTVARFAGTWRMWNGHRDGFHIYTLAQLLGILLPILIAGRTLFQPISLGVVLAWSYLYWLQRPFMRGAPLNAGPMP